jgi:hypothetical protein
MEKVGPMKLSTPIGSLIMLSLGGPLCLTTSTTCYLLMVSGKI